MPAAVTVQQNDLAEWPFLPNNFVKSLPSYVELISELVSIPPNTVGLLLGHSSLTSEGVSVHTGIIDPGYEGEIQIIMFSFVPWSAKRGKRVAQLLLIPYTPSEKKGTQKRGTRGFGSTGLAFLFLAEKISGIHPVCQIEIQGKKFKGLLDIGADVSIISFQEWPVN